LALALFHCLNGLAEGWRMSNSPQDWSPKTRNDIDELSQFAADYFNPKWRENGVRDWLKALRVPDDDIQVVRSGKHAFCAKLTKENILHFGVSLSSSLGTQLIAANLLDRDWFSRMLFQRVSLATIRTKTSGFASRLAFDRCFYLDVI
jgi:hypothetical protein